MTVLHCSACDRVIKPGEKYVEELRAVRVVGESPPMYAAKFNWCEQCDELASELIGEVL